MDKQPYTQSFLTLTKEQKAARISRAKGILIGILLFAALIYIATYAKFGG